VLSNEFDLIVTCSIGEGGPQGNYVASGYSVYEEENEHLQEGLKAKVNALKHVSRLEHILYLYIFTAYILVII